MSSNKNLKVYKMQFMTEIKTLHMNVKFNCKIKATWKRSTLLSDPRQWIGRDHMGPVIVRSSSLQPDLETQCQHVLRYHQKQVRWEEGTPLIDSQCLYSFVISTEKGEKSAGSVTIDLAEFFNKSVYGTTSVYSRNEWSLQSGEMSSQGDQNLTEDLLWRRRHWARRLWLYQVTIVRCSCISSTNQMDNSMASDLGDIVPTGSFFSEVEIEKS